MTKNPPSRRKAAALAAGGVLTTALVLGGLYAAQIARLVQAAQNQTPPPTTVTAATVQALEWPEPLSAVGTVDPVQAVTLRAELAGVVDRIAFAPGQAVRAGALLVQQDVRAEQARLAAARAEARRARLERDRIAELFARELAARSALDLAEAQLAAAEAEVEAAETTLARKTLRAPFAGRVGTLKVNIGQYLAPGDPVVTVLAEGPRRINFALPQADVGRLQPGLPVEVRTDALPAPLAGRISAVEPAVDPQTRLVSVQATVEDGAERLLPGMFVDVTVVPPQTETVLAVPVTAVRHAPFGDSVFVIETGEDGGTILQQQFVRLGRRRGDFVQVLEGLQAGQRVASSGVFKLRNGEAVRVDDRLAPDARLDPVPSDG